MKLLLVEDDKDLCYVIKENLEKIIGGYEVICKNNGKEGLMAFSENEPDVVAADLDMPVMTGDKMMVEIKKKNPFCPVLIISGIIDSKTVSNLLSQGADNFIKKPFDAVELDSYIKAVFRTAKSLITDKTIKIWTYTFDPKKRELLYSPKNNSKEISKIYLHSKEALILDILCKNIGKVVSREDILSFAWGDKASEIYSHCLDNPIHNIRKYLSKDSSIKVKTIKKLGFELDCSDSKSRLFHLHNNNGVKR